MTVWTINLPKPEALSAEEPSVAPGTKCCKIMTVGKDYKDLGKWVKNKKRIPCPNKASRIIEGKTYCSMHSHKVRRKPPE